MEPNLQKDMQVMDSFIGRYGSFKNNRSSNPIRLLTAIYRNPQV